MTHSKNGSSQGSANAFSELGLIPELQKAVLDKGYTTPTPVQAQAIPLILHGEDVLGGAQTGTGKTAAFVLPILQRLGKAGGPKSKPRALILTPTRELAAQVHQSVVDYGTNIKMFSTCIYGGVGMTPQIRAIRRGIDIIVATPGRLLDHMGQGHIDLSKVETFVLDEADRMLDMGFIHDIRKVEAELPKDRQNLLFSATYSDDIRKLAQSILHNPVSVEVTPRNTAADTITHKVHPVAKGAKKDLLVKLIKENNWYRILVFTRTKHGADRLAKQLYKEGIVSAAIHGNKSQAARTKALKEFKAGKVQTLVATDIAARGIDIDELPHVVNYELPNIPEDYIHRIGRTGRAGADGLASSLVSADENSYLRGIEKLLKKGIEVERIEGFEQEQDAGPPPHVVAGRKRNALAEERRRQFGPRKNNNRDRFGDENRQDRGDRNNRNERSGSKGRRQDGRKQDSLRQNTRPERDNRNDRSPRENREERGNRNNNASKPAFNQDQSRNRGNSNSGGRSGRSRNNDKPDFSKARRLIDEITGKQTRN